MPEIPSVSNTATKSLSGIEKRLRNLRPFGPGPDPRRHKGGRPKSFDQARALAQQIVNQKLGESGLSVIEAIFRQWAKSPQHQKDLIEYAFGKVPDKLETTGLENKTNLVLYFNHERGLTIDEDNSRSPSEISSGTD